MSTNSADSRRATALVVHYGRSNSDGMTAVLDEAANVGRAMELVAAVLNLHSHVVPVLLSADGLACLTQMVYRMADDAELVGEDLARAARLVTAHSEQDMAAIAELLPPGTTAEQAAQAASGLLALYISVVPFLYSELGLSVLERNILDWAAREESGQ